ncbi:MAG: DUF3786 domain-containing protein [Lachnospiraceae bacterium]|nr:DUF3786 domain-containing protein [Lachnospiraceae bacterium]
MDHYKALEKKWGQIFASMDHRELQKRFSLEEDNQALYITYFQQRYGINKAGEGITLMEDPGRELSFQTVMAIYHLFYYSRPEARIRGEFVPFRLVKRAAPFEAAYQRNILEPLARSFDGHLEELKRACQALGGRPVPQGDVGCVIDAFSCMPLTFVFWDGDEEFRAQANILFDADITDFLHEETVVLVAEELARRLKEEAGLAG